MDKTIEEILLEQLEQPVILKNGSVAENPRTGEPLMPEEAICMSIVQKAMNKLDCQEGNNIFGGGFLISERAAKERERAAKERERAAKERERVEKEEREKRAIMWELSEREKEIVRSLGGESLPG